MAFGFGLDIVHHRRALNAGAASLSLSGSASAGNEGSAFAFTATRTNGSSPFTYSITGGTPLPPWASLNTGTGTISGNPLEGHNGTTNVNLHVVDALGAAADLAVSLVVNNNLLLGLSGSPGSVGETEAFSWTPTRVNGVDPLTYSISLGTLPAWASLNTLTGAITGTPADGQNGTTNVTLRAVDSSSPTAQALLPISIVVNNTISIGLSGAPTSVNEGAAFSFTPTRTNGTGPFVYSILTGTLPAWASLNTSTGAITGTPADGQNGSTNVTIRVTDSLTATADLPITILVNDTIGSGLTGPYAYPYNPGWTPNTGTNVVTRPAQSIPGKATDITDLEAVNPFGCYWLQMTQIADDPSSGTMMRHYYSKRATFNSDGSAYVAYASDPNSYGYPFSVSTLDKFAGGRTASPGTGAIGLASTFPVSSSREGMWDPVDPALFHYAASSSGDLIYKTWNKNTLAVTNLVDFTSRMTGIFGSGVVDVWPKQEGRCSNDGRYWAFQARKSGGCAGYFTWDRQTDTILGSLVTTNDANWITMSPLGNFAVIGWANASGQTKAQCAAAPVSTTDGVRSYNLTFSTFTQINNRAQHGDVMVDVAGNEVFVGVSDDSITLMPGVPQGRCYYANLATGAVTLLPIDVYEGSNAQAIHFSGMAINKPGHAFFSTAGGGSVTAKYENMIGSVELRPSGATVRRYAYHYSTPSGNYWAEPHVTVSASGEIVAWATDYNATNVVMCGVLLPYQATPYYGTTGGGTGTGPDLSFAVQSFGFNSTNTTAHSCTMATPIPAGSGILVVCGMDGAANLTNPLSLATQGSANQAAASNFKVTWLWKVAAGTEGGTAADFITDVAERGSVQMWIFAPGSFTGSPQIVVGSETTTLTPDPPSITASGGTASYWIGAVAVMGTTMSAGPSAYPYASGQTFTGLVGAASANDVSIASCWQKSSGLTFNPGVITFPGTQVAAPSFAYTVILKSN